MVVWVGSAIAVLGIAGAWLVARVVSRRAHHETRAEVMALRTELAGALARISSRDEAAAIMARVDAAVADEPAKKRRGGLVLIKGGGLAVAAIAGTAASGLARRAREHPGIALVAATAAAGTATVALLSPFSGGAPEALREPPAPRPSASAPATSPPHAVSTPTPTPTPAGHRPGQAEPRTATPADNTPTNLTPGPGTAPQPEPIVDEPQPQPGPSTTPRPPGSDPTPDPEPTPTPKPTPTPTPTPQPPHPDTHCTLQVGHLVCVKLPLPI